MNPRSDLSRAINGDDSRAASEDLHEKMQAADAATAQVGAEIVIQNAETVQQALRSGAAIAVQMTEYSAASINAIVKSNVDDLAELAPAMSRDWMRFAQEGIEHGFDRFRCLLQYRAPQHLVDLPEEVVPCANT